MLSSGFSRAAAKSSGTYPGFSSVSSNSNFSSSYSYRHQGLFRKCHPICSLALDGFRKEKSETNFENSIVEEGGLFHSNISSYEGGSFVPQIFNTPCLEVLSVEKLDTVTSTNLIHPERAVDQNGLHGFGLRGGSIKQSFNIQTHVLGGSLDSLRVSNSNKVDDSDDEEEKKEEGDSNSNVEVEDHDIEATNQNNISGGNEIVAGLNGLENLGNTCYMNSVIQCLAHISILTDYFANDLYSRFEQMKRETKEDRLVFALSVLFSRIWKSGSNATLRPIEVKKAISRVSSRFSGYEQHDAQEFLLFLLDVLHESLNRIHEKVAFEEMKDISDETTLECSKRYWNFYEKQNDSHIKDVFVGQLFSEVLCGNCGAISAVFEPFMDLSIPLPDMHENSNISVLDCLEAFTARESLCGAEAYFCSKCKAHSDSSKSIKIQRLPEVLVLHLKRFTNSMKLTTAVEIPHILNVANFCSEDFYSLSRREEGTEYKLVGVVNHLGGFYGGHYIADCLNNTDNSWYRFNDSNVSKIEPKEINQQYAYLLFYSRIRQDRSNL